MVAASSGVNAPLAVARRMPPAAVSSGTWLGRHHGKTAPRASAHSAVLPKTCHQAALSPLDLAGGICGPEGGGQPACKACLKGVADESKNRTAHPVEGQPRQHDRNGQAHTACALLSIPLPQPCYWTGQAWRHAPHHGAWLLEGRGHPRAIACSFFAGADAGAEPVLTWVCE